jgi:aldose 1-epimerase
MKSIFTLSLFPLLVLSAWAPPGLDGKYTLTAPGITVKFILYAACITNLIVADRNGTSRDVILGYDNSSFYPVLPIIPTMGRCQDATPTALQITPIS